MFRTDMHIHRAITIVFYNPGLFGNILVCSYWLMLSIGLELWEYVPGLEVYWPTVLY